MWSNNRVLVCFGILLVLCFGSRAERQEFHQRPSLVGDNREGKIFDQRFWNGFERGLKDTASMFTRVTDNVETTLDQLSDNFENNFFRFVDDFDFRNDGTERSDSNEDSNMSASRDDFKVDAITGSLDGVDEGLRIYSPEEKPRNPERRRPSKNPSVVRVNPDAGVHDNTPVGFGIHGSIFKPFGRIPSFGAESSPNIFNIFRRRQWWQGQNVCVERQEIDESDSNKSDKKPQAEIETAKHPDAEVETDKADETSTVSKRRSSISSPSIPQVFSFGFGSMEMSSCEDTGEKYTCITRSHQRGIHKTVTVTYRCCHGFVRDGYGCTKVDLRNVTETLESLGTTSDFLSLLKAADLIELLEGGNFTLFVPNNEAVEEFTVDLEEKNDIDNDVQGNRDLRRKRSTSKLAPTLLAHVTKGFIYAGDVRDEEILQSLNENSPLRINTYNSDPPSITVNCARIITANQHAFNGVVHTIDKVITPAEKSIAHIITSDPQFSILKQLLSKTSLVETLGKDGQLTFFAPTDSAFRKLKPSILESLLAGNSCLEAVLKQHLLPNTICSSAIQGKKRTMNLLEDFLIVERTEDEKLFVEDAQIVARDIVATNGVVHIIDKVLVPNEAKSVGEVLETHNLTRFLELLEQAELLEELNSQGDITVFAPSNKAFENFPEESLEKYKNNKEDLKTLLRYHMTSPSIKARNIDNNHVAKSTSGHPLRVNLYSGVPLLSNLFRNNDQSSMRVTVGCSRVSLLDSRACGAVVHVIEEVMEIPKSNIMEALNASHLSLFRQMVQDTAMDQVLEGEGPYTLLVPSDHALKTLPEEELAEIMNDQKLKEKIVKGHILKEHICCSGIHSNTWLFSDRKRAIDGSLVHIRRGSNGRLMAGPARITKCGAPTGNGLIHTVNRMIMDERDMGGFREGVDTPIIHPFPAVSKLGILFGI